LPDFAKTALFLFLIGSLLHGAGGYTSNTRGNRLFGEGKYDDALKEYMDANIKAPETPEVQYNMANTFYKQKKYDKALESYDKALMTDDKEVYRKVHFNKACALFRKGEFMLKQGKREGLGQWESAISGFKKVLDLDPDDKDAKTNIEIIRIKLKEMMKPQDQQQQQQQKQKKIQPSEYAKKMKKLAEKEAEKRRYIKAHAIMEKLFQKDSTAVAYQEFDNRLKDINEIHTP
jgi:Ca-activated chloride channel family protein